MNYNDHFCVSEATYKDNADNDATFECPTWFWKVHIRTRWKAGVHGGNSLMINWTASSDNWTRNGDWRPTDLKCCVRL